ncbi:MAG: hypothetical protein JKX74_09695 [Flavobacteriales bacterium]|nr:hypothetical protein [Flavobacteriales bacterium]
MKNRSPIITLFFASILILTSFASCKKYEEGPAFTLSTKKARVANEWKVDYAFDFDDNLEVTSDYVGETWEFTKDGEWTERDSGIIDKTGTWEFVSDKEGLQINRTGTGTSTSVYTILKLKQKEMWLKDKDEELHLIPN